MTKATDTVTISKKDFDLLTSLYPDISGLKRHLENFVHPKYIKEIDEISNKMKAVFTPFWEEEEKSYAEDSQAISDISDEHKFKSIWSISEVTAKQMNDKFPSPIKQIAYKDQVTSFDSPKNLSWLEMWKEADKLIRMSGDGHHIFVEGFDEDNKNSGHYKLVTGS